MQNKIIKEFWLPVKGFEGIYAVSDQGGVRRLDTKIYFKGTLGLRKGRILKTTRNSKGYDTIVLCYQGKRKTYAVHRLVMTSFSIDSPLQVNHKNGEKQDNSLNNLEWSTPGQNQTHAYDTGLKGHGSESGMSKLSEPSVLQIKIALMEANRKKQSNTSLYKGIAEEYGVSFTSIKWIDKGKTWRKVLQKAGYE